jgi:hypothetical protein
VTHLEVHCVPQRIHVHRLYPAYWGRWATHPARVCLACDSPELNCRGCQVLVFRECPAPFQARACLEPAASGRMSALGPKLESEIEQVPLVSLLPLFCHHRPTGARLLYSKYPARVTKIAFQKARRLRLQRAVCPSRRNWIRQARTFPRVHRLTSAETMQGALRLNREKHTGRLDAARGLLLESSRVGSKDWKRALRQ